MSQRLACSGRLSSGSGSGGGGSGAAAILAVPSVAAASPSADCVRALHLPPSPKLNKMPRRVDVELPRSQSILEPLSAAKKKVVGHSAMKNLPYFCRGEVVKGFGRGSKDLGIPTANFPEHVVDNLPNDLSTGIYYGWGCVGNGDVHKMVMSIGWNPFYKNTKKSVETHIIHQFGEDFYGEILSIVIAGYIRPEKSFDSLDSLIAAIHSDIEEAKKQLDLPELQELKDHYFNSSSHTIMNGHH
ncbi:riboflavin kinase [Rhinophrynus dorsalis]